MKKILLTAAMMLVGLTMSATKYIGTISVSINDEGSSQEATVGLVEQNGKYTLSIKNFMLGEDTPVGNVILTDLTPTDNADGSKSLSYSGVIMIPAGDDPRFAEDEWLGLMLNELGGVPVTMTATFNDTDLTCHIDIDMRNTLKQMIEVDFTTESGSEVKPGDVNGDGEVNVSDVVALANFAMGETPEGFVKEAGDLNNDGEMNVSDVVILANKVMG